MFSPQINVRSCFNFQDSLITIEDYINFASLQEFDFAFYSDIETMYGAADFVKAALQKNIKPIIGLTIDFKKYDLDFRLTLFAKNLLGYQIICKLSSLIMCQELKQTNEIIIETIISLLDKNLVGIISFFNNFNEQIAQRIQNQLLAENLFFGIDRHALKIPVEFQARQVFAQDVKYFEKADFFAFKVLQAIKNNELLKDQSLVDDLNYFYSNDQIAEIIDLKTHKDNIVKIASMCNFNMFENKKNHLMKYPNSKNIPSNNFLRLICEQSLNGYFKNAKKMSGIPKIYIDRLEQELETITSMGFADYFLVVYDFVKKAKELEIFVGPGRGSAVGSLVAFLLKITTVDPLEYNLIFERFLNSERINLPDIDIDFQDDRREEVIEYIFEKYGRYNVATITTFQTIGTKNSIRDCGRVFGIDAEDLNKITKPIGNEYLRDLDGAVKNFPALENFINQNPQIYQVAKKIIGLPRQTGTHAAGLVFCDVDLREVVPLKVGYNGINQTQYSMNYLEELGLIKIDLLGLRNLTTLKNIIQHIEESRKIKINLQKIPLSDFDTFASLQKGETTGIFQLESPGMTNVIQKMKVASIEDIAVASALFRPGPQENIPLYIERKSKKTSYELINHELAEILDPTYGIIIYQEQVIQILQKVAKLSLAQSDIVRRAMGKKDFDLMTQEHEIFLQGAVKNGYSQKEAQEIWSWILKFASYGFNKSHAIAYSLIGYWLAYLKQHFPSEFYCELLSSAIGNEYKTNRYIEESKLMGIKIISPTIKNPRSNYFGNELGIHLPLILINKIGMEFTKGLQELKNNNPKIYSDLFIFVAKAFKNGLNNQVFSNLAKSGALDCFGINRETILANKEKLLLFGDLNQDVKEISPFTYPKLEFLPDNPIQRGFDEIEVLGFYLSNHPLTVIKEKINNKDLLKPINQVNKPDLKSPVLFIVESIRSHQDKNGNEMLFLEISDETGKFDLTVFASTVKSLTSPLEVGQIMVGEIKTQAYNNKITGILNKILKVY
ncbi:DNA polymerase III subunit alpha [Spiroplasma sabaudiense Ar-1343]|uniref:DNA-directed DNA polymerase n=1 Tax=Spiroplasma sabaudiense Ar-1343 TaxID=1276257 RepID=W6AK35_9MOLU|nr:DNA polymerase III subunit alpha [Spiroplasma sabaudiense]AHI54089.1 DNA polymerase III subunit alpha [Spiroplasma sabaudiense Ar-1343]